jgi:NADP-dependent 3-hydroxy acid dehydrogenase YdfG
MMDEFHEKTCAGDGAAGGIGATIVGKLRAAGARVAVPAMTPVSSPRRIDLLDRAYDGGLPQAAADALGGLDILVNDAGVITRGP